MYKSSIFCEIFNLFRFLSSFNPFKGKVMNCFYIFGFTISKAKSIHRSYLMKYLNWGK